MPIAIYMEPGPDIGVDVHQVGKVGADLGKVLTALLPQVPSVFTAQVGTEVGATSIHPKVQASGLLRHECTWRVADSKIAYNFNPALIVQFSKSRSITVSAKLHVDVRKRVLGVFRKTYGKNATPMWYVYEPG